MWEPKELRLDWRHPWARTVGACRIRVFGGLRPGRDQSLLHIQRRSPTPSVPVWSLSSLSLSSLSLSLSSLSGLVACRVVPVSSGLVDVPVALAASSRGRSAVATPPTSSRRSSARRLRASRCPRLRKVVAPNVDNFSGEILAASPDASRRGAYVCRLPDASATCATSRFACASVNGRFA